MSHKSYLILTRKSEKRTWSDDTNQFYPKMPKKMCEIGREFFEKVKVTAREDDDFFELISTHKLYKMARDRNIAKKFLAREYISKKFRKKSTHNINPRKKHRIIWRNRIIKVTKYNIMMCMKKGAKTLDLFLFWSFVSDYGMDSFLHRLWSRDKKYTQKDKKCSDSTTRGDSLSEHISTDHHHNIWKREERVSIGYFDFRNDDNPEYDRYSVEKKSSEKWQICEKCEKFLSETRHVFWSRKSCLPEYLSKSIKNSWCNEECIGHIIFLSR